MPAAALCGTVDLCRLFPLAEIEPIEGSGTEGGEPEVASTDERSEAAPIPDETGAFPTALWNTSAVPVPKACSCGCILLAPPGVYAVPDIIAVSPEDRAKKEVSAPVAT